MAKRRGRGRSWYNGEKEDAPGHLKYNEALTPDHKDLCDVLAAEIDRNLPKAESKIWHAHPVWFLKGNPTVG